MREEALQVIQRVEADPLHRLAVKTLVQYQGFRFCYDRRCARQVVQRLLTGGLIRYLKACFQRVGFPAPAAALNLFHFVEIQLTRLIDRGFLEVFFQSGVFNRAAAILMHVNVRLL